MKTSSVITHSVIVAHQDEPMEAVIQRMIEERVSSILVKDDQDNIVGIITERDIVRKFTLISKQDKLKAKVITVMTRPVSFVRLDHLDKDISQLHTKLGIRHFPILEGNEAHLDQLVGMLTSTDMFRIWLQSKNKSKSNVPVDYDYRMILISSHKVSRAKYKKVFENMNCEVQSGEEYLKLIAQAQSQKSLLLFDLDDDFGKDGPILLTKAVGTGSHVLFLTNRISVASEFKKDLKTRSTIL